MSKERLELSVDILLAISIICERMNSCPGLPVEIPKRHMNNIFALNQ